MSLFKTIMSKVIDGGQFTEEKIVTPIKVAGDNLEAKLASKITGDDGRNLDDLLDESLDKAASAIGKALRWGIIKATKGNK